MVPVVQLVERQIVVLLVAGSSPVGHPIIKTTLQKDAHIVNDSNSLEIPKIPTFLTY